MSKIHAGHCSVAGPTPEPSTVNHNHVFFNAPDVYPEYLTDVNVLQCPSDPDGHDYFKNYFQTDPVDPCRFWDVSYQYTGWALNEEHYLLSGADINDLPADTAVDPGFLIDVGTMIIQDDNDASWDTVHEDDISLSNGTTAYRLREGIERFFISDINNPAASAQAQSEIVVMQDIAVWTAAPSDGQPSYNHVPGGGNVLYMDGHVEFLKYPSEHPLCTTWVYILETLSASLTP
jgi:prepilin-type processing-associated H-X9-DG protein